LISEKRFSNYKILMINQFVNANSNLEGIAENLAEYYALYGDINLINSEIELYHSITMKKLE
jgi:predicted Zn-dependent peptidase